MSAYVIASTLGLDLAELKNYRYQSTKINKAVYAIGEEYFLCSTREPRDLLSLQWLPFEDQLFAKSKNTILWIAKERN